MDSDSDRMDSDSDSMSSEAQCVYVYPNVTKVDPSQFSVDEDLKSLRKLLTMQKHLSKPPNIRLCDNNEDEECSSDVDMQCIELINEKQFDVDDTFMYMTNVEQHGEETERTEEEQLKIFQNLLLLHTTRSIASETDNLMSRSKEVQVDMDLKEKDTCGYIAVSRENQVLAYYLRCYYCAEMYPLGYWQQFIKHMNTVHNLLENMEANVDLKFASSSETSVHTNKLCILEDVVLPKLSIPPAITNEPGTTNVNETTNANSTSEQTLQAKRCNTECATYNSSFSWNDVWDSDSDAESTLDKKTASPNIDHCYSQGSRAPLANKTLKQSDMKPAKNELKSNGHEPLANITLNQNDVKPTKIELKSNENESLENTALNHNYVKPTKPEYEIDFDHTDSAIVMDFLDLLTSFPVLWYSRTELARAYDFAVENLYKMLNIRWELNFTPASFRKSLDKIKAWYRSTLANTNTGSASFEEYFEKCSEFLPASDDGQPPDLLCDICNESCHDDAYLLVHKFKAHAVGQLPYECGICGATFFQVDNLGSHLNRHKNQYPLPKQLIFPAGKGKRRMKCERCSKIFYEEAAMKDHACELCPYFCNLCDEKFTLLNEYRAHRKQSHQRAKHKCGLCGQEFSQLNYYNDHMKVHRRRFDYLCDICGKLFVRHRSFIEHMQCVHQGMAHCAICNCNFVSSSTLHSHRVRFHLVREGTCEDLSHFKQQRRERLQTRKYERVYDNPTSKRFRIRCPLCPATYYGYDSLYAHGLRAHGKQLQDPCKKPVNSNVKAPKTPKRINVASAFPELIHAYEEAANVDAREGNASSATADNSVPSAVTAAVADNASSTADATSTALVMTEAVTAEPSVPEWIIAEEEVVQSTTESKPGHHIQNSRKKRRNANVKSHKKTKCKSVAPELTYIYEDASNIDTTEDIVSSEGTAAVADNASSKAPATAFVTTSAVSCALSMPELLTAEDETAQATTELKQLTVDKFKIGSDRLFSGDVYEDAEFEYVLNATVMELERY